jgi:hypothetical protein
MRALIAMAGLIAATMALQPVTGDAATITFGSSLSVPASRDTANDLAYSGSNVALPGSIFHINHDGADTALWNIQLASGTPAAPGSGQIVSVSLEGCAESNGPPPLTQIHFQDLVPQGGGAMKVNVTTQAFEIPVCGQGGASGSTVSTYQPTNFCVAQGDYVDFNDEGGFVSSSSGPPPYPSGVPYMVIGSVPGSTMDSFVRNGGVGNRSVFSPTDTTYHDGFASNPGEELMLQATLATGPDATPLCPGGTKGTSSLSSYGTGGPRPHHHHFPLVTLPHQQDGMNAHGVVQVAVFCHAPSGFCHGTLWLYSRGRGNHGALLGKAPFSVAAQRTGKIEVHLGSFAQHLIGRAHGAVRVDAALTGDPPAGNIFKASIALQGGHRR